MSWLYSIVFAGLMFSSGSNLPKFNNYSQADSTVQTNIKQDETERFEQTYPLNANGRVNVSNVNGSINVDTWDKNEIKLEYVKTADNRERLSEVEVKIDARQDSFSVETDYGNWKQNDGKWNKNNRFEIQYHLTVPRNAVLDEIETVNGSVSIVNAGNLTKASAVNGEVKATNLRGTASLSTVNGSVIADFDALQSGSKISLETVNGTADLIIPSDANATVKADTVNGQINNDFGLPVRKGQYVGRDLYGRIGSGDVQIRLNSVNGALSVRRKNDSKTINPATNLLNLKSGDNDEDWDNDNGDNSGVRSPRPPKPPKSPKTPTNEEINKSVKQSLKDAQKEIEKIQPELEKINAEAYKEAMANINSEKMKAQVEQAQEKYKEAMTRMDDINWTDGSSNIENKSESFTVKETPKVTVDVKNCAVSVRGWDKQEVNYSITRFSKMRGQSPLDLTAQQNGSDITIKSTESGAAQNSDVFNELNRVRLEIFVPKKSNLKITTAGEIRLEGVSGTIDLRGADSAINVRDGDGLLTVNGNDARIRIIGFRGEVESRTVNGAMFLEGGFQRLLAETSDGTIVLDVPENTNANLTSNREINFEGIDAPKKSDKNWSVGSGGANYFLQSADGEIFVRPVSAIKTN